VGSYSLLIKPSATKELEDLPLEDRRRVARRMTGLADQPRPPGHERLTGRELYRVRQGDYRILYEVSDRERTVTVIRIGHRRDVYR
jgi:mRNA interferase RelE/StbE